MTADGFTLATIVEGHGDVVALPLLVRMLRPRWTVLRPIRVNRWKIPQERELERYAGMAAEAIRGRDRPGGLLVCIDAEEDAACSLGPSLLHRARRCVPDVPVEVVVAVKTFECWLIAGGAVRGHAVPDAPESIATPKRWISERLGTYRETVDQPKLAARIDPTAAASASPSFAKLLRCLEALEASR